MLDNEELHKDRLKYDEAYAEQTLICKRCWKSQVQDEQLEE